MASGKPQIINPNDTALSESPSPPSKKVRATANKAGSLKKMTDKEQSARFVETARMLEVDESGNAFDRAVKKVIAHPDSAG